MAETTLGINGLVPGFKYNVRVRGTFAGTPGPWSATEEIDIFSDTTGGTGDKAPSPPTSLSITPTIDSFIVKWNSPTTNTDGTILRDMKEHVIEVRAESYTGSAAAVYTLPEVQNPSVLTAIDRAKTFEFTYKMNKDLFGGLGNAGPYFTIYARDTTNNKSSVVNQREVNLSPDAPTALTATAAVGGANVSWSGGTSGDIVSYILKYSTSSGFDPSVAGATVYQGTLLNYSFSGTAGVPYYFRVGSVDVFGQISWYGVQGSATPLGGSSSPIYNPPVAPTGFVNLWAETSYTVYWSASTSPAVDIKNYKIDITSGGVTESFYSDGTIYELTLQEANTRWPGWVSNGPSAVSVYTVGPSGLISDPLVGTGIAPIPSTPTPPTLSTQFVAGGVRVYWSPPTDTDNIIRFVQVYAGLVPSATPTTLYYIGSNVSGEFTIPFSPTYNGSYYFRSRILDKFGRQSAYSGEASAIDTVNPGTLAQPSASSNTMEIQVTQPASLNGGGTLDTDIREFLVYAGTTTTPTTEIGVIPYSGSAVSHVATFKITPTDGGGANTTQNWYVRTKARDWAGNISDNYSPVSTLSSVPLISSANIGEATITSAKINTLEANKLVAGTGIIDNLTIGQAANDGSIKSYDYNAGVDGWYIGSDGSGNNLLEINNGTIRAGALQIAGTNANILPVQWTDFEFDTYYYIGRFGAISCTTNITSERQFFNGQSCRVDTSNVINTIYLADDAADRNLQVNYGDAYIISAYIYNNSGAGTTVSFRYRYFSGSTLNVDIPAKRVSNDSTTIPANQWVQIYAVVETGASGNAPGDHTISTIGMKDFNAVSHYFIDGVMIEKRLGSVNTPSAFVGPSQTIIEGDQITTGSINTERIGLGLFGGNLINNGSFEKTGLVPQVKQRVPATLSSPGKIPGWQTERLSGDTVSFHALEWGDYSNEGNVLSAGDFNMTPAKTTGPASPRPWTVEESGGYSTSAHTIDSDISAVPVISRKIIGRRSAGTVKTITLDAPVTLSADDRITVTGAGGTGYNVSDVAPTAVTNGVEVVYTGTSSTESQTTVSPTGALTFTRSYKVVGTGMSSGTRLGVQQYIALESQSLSPIRTDFTYKITSRTNTELIAQVFGATDISSVTISGGNLLTAVTAEPHGLSSSTVMIDGLFSADDTTSYSGEKSITVTNSTTFTIVVSGGANGTYSPSSARVHSLTPLATSTPTTTTGSWQTISSFTATPTVSHTSVKVFVSARATAASAAVNAQIRSVRSVFGPTMPAYDGILTMLPRSGQAKAVLGKNSTNTARGTKLTSDGIEVETDTKYTLGFYYFGDFGHQVNMSIEYSTDKNFVSPAPTVFALETPSVILESYTLPALAKSVVQTWTSPGPGYARVVISNSGTAELGKVYIEDAWLTRYGSSTGEITDAGIRLFDETGAETVSLFSDSSDGGDFLKLGSAINIDGGSNTITSGTVATDEMYIAGNNFQSYFDLVPRGIIARGARTTPKDFSGNPASVVYLEVSAYMYPDRSYRLSTSNVRIVSNQNSVFTGYLSYTSNGDRPVKASTVIGQSVVSRSGTTGDDVYVHIDRYFSPSTEGIHRFLLWAEGSIAYTGTMRMSGVATAMPAQINIEDIGPSIENTGIHREADGDTNPNRTSDRISFLPKWSSSYTGSGSSYDAISWNSTLLTQGYFSGLGNRKSAIAFDIDDALIPGNTGTYAGTIVKVEVLLQVNSSANGDGLEVVIGLHKSNVATAPDAWSSIVGKTTNNYLVTKLARQQKKWVDITGLGSLSDWNNATPASRYRGITIGPGTTSNSQYAGTLYESNLTFFDFFQPTLRISYYQDGD